MIKRIGGGRLSFDRRDMRDRKVRVFDGITKLVLKLTEFLKGRVSLCSRGALVGRGRCFDFAAVLRTAVAQDDGIFISAKWSFAGSKGTFPNGVWERGQIRF